MQRNIITFLLCIAVMPLAAHIHGIVMDSDGQPLAGANVLWLGTTSGVATDADGMFAIEPTRESQTLVTTYLGYRSDTTTVADKHASLAIVLFPENMDIDDVTITARKQDIIRSRLSTFNTQTLTGSELCKAACCNLSESFETSAAVDVAYADAATGAKQIRLLGLAGTYVQLLTENTPQIRGLAQNFGMEYIPGPWMEAIQVSKGTSSVVNGYESTTGQINVEYLKPKLQDPIAINLMLNTELHSEINITGGWDVSPRHIKESLFRGNDGVYTGVLAHAQLAPMNMDDNKDGFVDMPMGYNVNLLNRWDIFRGNYTGRILIRTLYDTRLAGQRYEDIFHHSEHPTETPTPYLIDLRTRRIEGFMKNGYVIDADRGMSIGIITAASYHSQDNIYGKRLWHATQANAYLNALFQTEFSEEHKLTAGLSLNHDTYRETLAGMPTYDNTHSTFDFSRRQTDVGLFAEYSYKPNEQLSLLVGMRGDVAIRQNISAAAITDPGTRVHVIPTPRLNLRYAPWEWWTIRASVGMGYRSANLVADNAQYLPSSRLFTTMNGNTIAFTDSPYFKQNMESALNAGLSTTFYIPIADRELQLTAEYYYTHFFDCVVADIETAGEIHFYNLSDIESRYGIEGARAYSHTAQVEASMEILRGWTMTLAYRHTDSRQTFYSPTEEKFVTRERPFVNRFKAIINTSYQTPLKHWQFDFTAQFNGTGRMPESFVIPEGSKQYFTKGNTIYHRWYPQLLAQITKFWRTCSLYVGAENMTNFTQHNPIISANQPFSPSFDASEVWAPTTGWKLYIGFRWNLTKDDDE